MRFSVLSFIILFVAFAAYLGWENGAFNFEQIAMPKPNQTQASKPVTEKSQQEATLNEALKSDEQLLMKEPETMRKDAVLTKGEE